MKLNWKWTSANLLVLAMIGCNGGDEPAESPAVGQGAPAPKVTPVAPTTSKSDTAKGEPATSQAPPDATKTEPKSDATKKNDDGPQVEGPKTDNSESKTGASSLTAPQLAAIKQLPESEQAAALKQVVCPVGGGPLGAMGKPFKVTYEGRSFYLCCDGCEDEVKADPKAIIAKLDKK